MKCNQENKAKQKAAEEEYKKLENSFFKKNLVPTMTIAFPNMGKEISETGLVKISRAYLK